NPSNNHLSSVLERRLGQPILLAIVWILLGAQAGVEVQGVGMPGHFLARVGGERGVVVDPFAGGKVLSRDECKAIFDRVTGGHVEWRDDFLLATPPARIAERV